MKMLYRLGLIIVVIALAACSPATSSQNLPYGGQLRGAVFDPPRELADFSLMSTTGEPFTLSEHRGQLILLYFGYRTCPDVCPTTFAELKRVYEELHEPVDTVKVVFVTVDPARDSLENLAQYTHAFHMDFIGLRGEGGTLQSMMNDFGVVATQRDVGDSPLAYLIDHTASVFLIAPDGKLSVQFLYGTGYKDILHDVRLVLDAV